MIPEEPSDLVVFIHQDRRGWWYHVEDVDRYCAGDPPDTEEVAAALDAGSMYGPFEEVEACFRAAQDTVIRNLIREVGPLRPTD